MAGCRQIEARLQALLDGELSEADRIVVRQHLDECAYCAAQATANHRMAAALYETLAPYRLNRDLRQSILDHLPVMDAPFEHLTAQDVDWQAKHPFPLYNMVSKFVPVAAGVLIVFLAAVIQMRWPDDAPSESSIGVVLQRVGEVTHGRVLAGETPQAKTRLSQYVEKDYVFATGPDGALMVALRGDTQLKMHTNTRVQIHDDRHITVEEGEVWLNVGKTGSQFKVLTASGDITVFGTIFCVDVEEDSTKVILSQGEVRVENNENSWQYLRSGDQVLLDHSSPILAPRKVDTEEVTKWANLITADEDANQLFREQMRPFMAYTTLQAEQLFIIRPEQEERHWNADAIELSWESNVETGPYSDYQVFVLDENYKSLFRSDISGDRLRTSVSAVIDVPAEYRSLLDNKSISIKIVRSAGPGMAESRFNGAVLSVSNPHVKKSI